MSNIYSIEYLESNKISEILYNTPVKDISFDLQLSETPTIFSSDQQIKHLKIEYEKLQQNRSNLNITNENLNNNYLNSSFINKFMKKYLMSSSHISYFWFIYNKQYEMKLPITSNKLTLRHVNKFTDIDKFINKMEHKKKGSYINMNTSTDKGFFNNIHDTIFISQNIKLNSNKSYNLKHNKQIIYGYNIYIKDNLYNLHKLITKRYEIFEGFENCTIILRPDERPYIREYVIFQRLLNNIMIGYQLLQMNGNMILAFENSSLEITKQLLYFLSSIFEKVELCNEIVRINHTVHFYVICYKFIGFNTTIFNKLVECDMKIDKYNKTFGEKLAFKSNKLNKLYNLDNCVKSFKLFDTYFVTNFIKYTKNENIEISINNIVIKNYNLAIYYLKFVNSEEYLNSKVILHIKNNQKIIANYILKKYFKFDIDIFSINKINKLPTNKIIRYISLIHIPRSGLTGLKKQLNTFSDKYYSISQRNMYFETDKYIYIILSIYHLSSINYPLTSTKITIVRNPYDRFISIFYYLKEGGKNNPIFPNAEKHTSNLFKKYNINKPIDIFTADKWIKNKILSIDFFKPQTSYICDNYYNKVIDQIYRFEEMNKLYDYLNRLLNIKLNVSNKINNTITKKELTEKEKEYIYEYYINDFNLLGYSR